MKKSTKTISTMLAAASLANMAIPAMTAFAAETNTNVDALIEKALKEKSFVAFNTAYGAIMQLDAKDQNAKLTKIAPLQKEIAQYDDIIAIIKQYNEFAKTEEVKTWYDCKAAADKITNVADQKYLLGEINTNGMNFINKKDANYVPATNAIIAANTAVLTGDAEKAEAGIKAAEEAIAKVAKAENRDYLTNVMLKDAKDAAAKLATTLTSVKATGVKKITLTFNKAVDTTKAVVTVKRGTVKPSVKATTWAEDKKSVVVEFNTAMAAGDYTATVEGLSEKALTGTTTVEAEKIASISFSGEDAIINTDSTKITTTLKAENQYGEDVTAKLSAATVNASKGAKESLTNKGVLTLVYAGKYTVGDKVVVTVVDPATGKVATATLNVVQAATVKTIELGEITTDKDDYKGETLNQANLAAHHSNYFIPVTVKDQYGNTLTASQITASTSILSSNTDVLTLGTVVDTDDFGTVIPVSACTSAGTAVVTAVATGTGASTNGTYTVKENAKLDTVTMETPENELVIGKKATLPMSIVDTYGNEVNLNDVTLAGSTGAYTLNTNTKINITGAELTKETDYVNKKSYIKITPSAKNIVISVVTANNKSQTLVLSANDAAYVAGIKSIKDDFVTMLANDATLNTTIKGNVVFQDQYGDDITAPTWVEADAVTTGYQYTVAKKSGTSTTLAAAGVISATTNAGTDVYTVTLYKDGVAVDSRDVEVKVVDKDKLTNFTIGDLNKFYTATAGATTHTQQVTVYGVVDGKKVVINQDMAKDFSATNGLTGFNATGLFTPADIDTDKKDVASTLKVLVETKDNTYTVTKDVVYSNVAPKAVSLGFKDGTDDVTADTVQVADPTTLTLVAKDQYGVAVADGFKGVITNNTTEAVYSVKADGTVAKDSGTPVSGKSFLLTAEIAGITKTLKVVIG